MDEHLDEERNTLLGELDHLNSLLGLTKSFVKGGKLKKTLTDLQNDVFALQAHIAAPEIAPDLPLDRILALQIEIGRIERRLKQLNHFILPEGASAACLLHYVRTQARRIERTTPDYLNNPTRLAKYLDRLAGLAFVLARQVNQASGLKDRPPAYVNKKPRKEQKNES